MLPFKISIPITLLKSPIKWIRNYLQIYRKIKFPPKINTGQDLIVQFGDIQTRIKKYEIVIFHEGNSVHRHRHHFNFGEGLPISIPKGGSATLNLGLYLMNCYEKCNYKPKTKNFQGQLIIYFVNDAAKKSPKYQIEIA